MKYSILIFTISAFLISGCNLSFYDEEKIDNATINSEVIIPTKKSLWQQYNCSSLDNGLTPDKVSEFSHESNDSGSLIFVTCFDSVEPKIVGWISSTDNKKTLLFVQREYSDETQRHEISNVTRFPFFSFDSQENWFGVYYYDSSKNRYYVWVSDKETYQDGSEQLIKHILEIDPDFPEKSKIVHTFKKPIWMIENSETWPQEKAKGFYFIGIRNHLTWNDDSSSFHFFSFDQLKEIPLWKVFSSQMGGLLYKFGEYKQEQVMYYIKEPKTSLRTWEIKNFQPRKIELELFRYVPSKNISEFVTKFSVLTSYIDVDGLAWSYTGEYPNIENFWIISEAVYVNKKIIFDVE